MRKFIWYYRYALSVGLGDSFITDTLGYNPLKGQHPWWLCLLVTSGLTLAIIVLGRLIFPPTPPKPDIAAVFD